MIYYFVVPVIKANLNFSIHKVKKKCSFCLTCVNSILTPLDLQHRIYLFIIYCQTQKTVNTGKI